MSKATIMKKLTTQIYSPSRNEYITIDFLGKTVSDLKRNKNEIIVPKENIVIHSDFQLIKGTYLMIVDTDYFVYEVNENNIILLKPKTYTIL